MIKSLLKLALLPIKLVWILVSYNWYMTYAIGMIYTALQYF